MYRVFNGMDAGNDSGELWDWYVGAGRCPLCKGYGVATERRANKFCPCIDQNGHAVEILHVSHNGLIPMEAGDTWSKVDSDGPVA